MRLLVDTNVFLDFFLKRDNVLEVKKFFIDAIKHKDQIYVTSISLRDIEYIAHKVSHDKSISKRVISETYSMCTKVVSITADDAISSIYSDIDDYEDSLIVEAAKREMANAIITSNKKDFRNSGFPLFTPKEYSEAIK